MHRPGGSLLQVLVSEKSAPARQLPQCPDLDWLASEPPWFNRQPMQSQGGNLVSPAQHSSLLVEPTRRYRQTARLNGSIMDGTDPIMIPVTSWCSRSRSRPEIWGCSMSLPFLRRRSGRSRSVNGYHGKPMTLTLIDADIDSRDSQAGAFFSCTKSAGIGRNVCAEQEEKPPPSSAPTRHARNVSRSGRETNRCPVHGPPRRVYEGH